MTFCNIISICLLAAVDGLTLPSLSQKHIDVAVIGSGFAGLSAGMEAANSGAKDVVIYEKMSVPGGNS